MSEELTGELLALAKSLGASEAGVASAARFDEALMTIGAANAMGYSGPLKFTYDDPATATDLSASYRWATSVITIAWDYLPASRQPSETGPIVARFATSDHYEKLRTITSALSHRLQELGFEAETLIDNNNLVDRAAASRSGVGWLGKSTMALSPGHGPWMLLGSVVTDADLSHSKPMRRDCGTCDACMPACQTAAITDSGLDARRCLSTWLQSPGSIPLWIRPLLGRRIYGCDDCLTSCPPGFKVLATAPDSPLELGFDELLALADQDLVDRFPWWYVPRRDGRFLRRNLLVAAGNSGESSAEGPIAEHLSHPSSMIRGHAYWAYARLLGHDASQRLEAATETETVADANDELRLALMSLGDPVGYQQILDGDERTRTAVTSL